VPESAYRLAMDEGRHAPERQRHTEMSKKELEGLLLLPSRREAQIEPPYRGQIEA